MNILNFTTLQTNPSCTVQQQLDLKLPLSSLPHAANSCNGVAQTQFLQFTQQDQMSIDQFYQSVKFFDLEEDSNIKESFWSLEKNLKLIQYMSKPIPLSRIKLKLSYLNSAGNIVNHYKVLIRRSINDPLLAKQFARYPTNKKKPILCNYFKEIYSQNSEDLSFERDFILIKCMSTTNFCSKIKSELSYFGSTVNMINRYKYLIRKSVGDPLLAQQFEQYPPNKNKPKLCQYFKEIYSDQPKTNLMTTQSISEKEIISPWNIGLVFARSAQELLEELNASQPFTEEEQREIAKMQTDLEQDLLEQETTEVIEYGIVQI